MTGTFNCKGMCRRTGLTAKECAHKMVCPYCMGRLEDGTDGSNIPLPNPIEALGRLAAMSQKEKE